jgi:hypothetical protein
LDPQDFFPGSLRRLKKLFLKRNVLHQRAVAGLGDIADYHAIEGIDPDPIIRVLEGQGFVAESVRYPTARVSVTRFVNRYIPLMQQLKITAQRFYDPS